MKRHVLAALAGAAAGWAASSGLARLRPAGHLRRLSAEQQWLSFAARAIASAAGRGAALDVVTVEGADRDGGPAVWRFRRFGVMPEVTFPGMADDARELEAS